MATRGAKRHHTVSRFLVDRFARDTPQGRRVCQLEITTGRTAQVGPRSVAVSKHFYSIDIAGERSPVVEETLGKVEDVAAPRIRSLVAGDFPIREQRLELALFIAMTRLRTPTWRDQSKSLLEQAVAVWSAETNRDRDAASVREAFSGTEWEALSDEELLAMRDEMVGDLDSGQIGVEMPVNNLIKLFLGECTLMGYVIFALDWTVVRTEGLPFVLGDTPVSLWDPTPPYPGSGAGVLSSPKVEMFIPLDPSFGIWARPNPEHLEAIRDLMEDLPQLSDEKQAEAIGPLEGGWAESHATEDDVNELNLRTYTHAQRYVFGSQEAVCRTHRFAHRNPVRRIAVTPAPPRIHILEADPDRPGIMRAVKVVEPETRKGRR